MKLLRRHCLPDAAFILGLKLWDDKEDEGTKQRRGDELVFHNNNAARLAARRSPSRVAHVSRVLAKASRFRGLFCKDCFGATPKVRAGLALARETRALPRLLQSYAGDFWGAQAASLLVSAACRDLFS